MSKFCTNCHKAMDSDATFCVECGTYYDSSKATTSTGKKESSFSTKPFNSLAISGLILSFFFPLVGLIVSIIGLKQVDKYDGQGKGAAIAGIINGAIRVGLVIFYILVMIVFRNKG